jgi:hypothetical protein
MNRDDRVLAIELARKHRANLGGLDVAGVALERPVEIHRDVLALPRPVGEDAEVVGLAAKRLGERAVALDALAALQNPLRAGLILPEIRR